MDAETLLPPETLENLYQLSHPEVLVRLTMSDACGLIRQLEIWHPVCGKHWSDRVHEALCNATLLPETPDDNRLFAISVAVHTDADGNLMRAAIIDSQEVTD